MKKVIEFDEKMARCFLTGLTQTAMATAFLMGWVICCATAALLLRIEKSVAHDLPSAKESAGNELPNGSGFVRRYFKKQLLRSVNFLAEVPEALGI